MHGYADNGDADAEVHGQLVTEQRGAEQARHQRRDGAGVLFEYGVRVLEEERRQHALHRVVHDQQERDLRGGRTTSVRAKSAPRCPRRKAEGANNGMTGL